MVTFFSLNIKYNLQMEIKKEAPNITQINSEYYIFKNIFLEISFIHTIEYGNIYPSQPLQLPHCVLNIQPLQLLSFFFFLLLFSFHHHLLPHISLFLPRKVHLLLPIHACCGAVHWNREMFSLSVSSKKNDSSSRSSYQLSKEWFLKRTSPIYAGIQAGLISFMF